MSRSLDFRNKFHFSAPAGWINDPNGLSAYNGAYHLFYQYNPLDTKWGKMHWGHAVSSDLIRWRHLPIALSPGEPYDVDGCFSGTAVEHEGKHVLMYTANRNGTAGVGGTARQVQCIAIGDGESYRKLAQNPVIASELLPAGSSRSDFRDPKLWREGDRWYCLVATRDVELGGELLLFTALDFEHWKFVGIVAHGGGTFGTMWECPDFFKIGDAEVLIWSPQNVPQDGCYYRNVDSSVYSFGELDRETGDFHGMNPEMLDFGPDFYAPQTLFSPDGRRILIAWMQMWGRTMPTDELHHGWAGSMTIPREIEIVGGALVQRPVQELYAYRANPRSIDELISGELSCPGLGGHYLDIEVTWESAGAKELGMILKSGRDEGTVISYLVDEGTLSLDRSRSGIEVRSTAPERPECLIYCCDLPGSGQALDLRVILDRSSCEIFADRGRRVITATLYPAEESHGVAFYARGGAARLRCTAWELSRDRVE